MDWPVVLAILGLDSHLPDLTVFAGEDVGNERHLPLRPFAVWVELEN